MTQVADEAVQLSSATVASVDLEDEAHDADAPQTCVRCRRRRLAAVIVAVVTVLGLATKGWEAAVEAGHMDMGEMHPPEAVVQYGQQQWQQQIEQQPGHSDQRSCGFAQCDCGWASGSACSTMSHDPSSCWNCCCGAQNGAFFRHGAQNDGFFRRGAANSPWRGRHERDDDEDDEPDWDDRRCVEVEDDDEDEDEEDDYEDYEDYDDYDDEGGRGEWLDGSRGSGWPGSGWMRSGWNNWGKWAGWSRSRRLEGSEARFAIGDWVTVELDNGHEVAAQVRACPRKGFREVRYVGGHTSTVSTKRLEEIDEDDAWRYLLLWALFWICVCCIVAGIVALIVVLVRGKPRQQPSYTPAPAPVPDPRPERSCNIGS